MMHQTLESGTEAGAASVSNAASVAYATDAPRVAVKPSMADRLLAMAHNYRSEGQIRQALGIYWNLAEDYAGTTAADIAREVLLHMAEEHERRRERHIARSMYERLARLEG